MLICARFKTDLRPFKEGICAPQRLRPGQLPAFGTALGLSQNERVINVQLALHSSVNVRTPEIQTFVSLGFSHMSEILIQIRFSNTF